MARKPPKRHDHAAMRRDYERVVPTAERLRHELEAQLSRLAEREEIALGFPIQSRTKSWDSIAEKIERNAAEVAQVTDLQDLVGLRLILQFKSQIDAVREAIASTLTVVREYDTSDRLKDDQFGYASIHMVIRLPEKWLTVPTMAGLGSLLAEVQIRTLAQHIWAAASHELQYKRESSVPPSIRRAIYRVSALLETVDLELDRVLVERREYVAQTGIDISASESALNVDLLEKTLDSLWPPLNKDKPEDYAEMLAELSATGIETPKALSVLAEEYRQAVMVEERGRLQYARETGEGVEEVERARRGVFYTHTGLTRTMLDQAFPHWRQNTAGLARALLGDS